MTHSEILQFCFSYIVISHNDAETEGSHVNLKDHWRQHLFCSSLVDRVIGAFNSDENSKLKVKVNLGRVSV